MKQKQSHKELIDGFIVGRLEMHKVSNMCFCTTVSTNTAFRAESMTNYSYMLM